MTRRHGKLQRQLVTYLCVAIAVLMAIFLVVDFVRQRRIMVESLSSKMHQEVRLFIVIDVGHNDSAAGVLWRGQFQ